MDKRNSLDFENFKEKLKESNDIVTIVSKYVNLERKGKRYWGCCPFHMEKTPSFAVLDDGQYYICYGCKATGDVITFIQKIENCDFIDACKILAKNEICLEKLLHSCVMRDRILSKHSFNSFLRGEMHCIS